MQPFSTGLQTKRSTDSHMPMKLLLMNVQSAESRLCLVGKCSLSKQALVEKRLLFSETLTLGRLLRKNLTLLPSTHQASHMTSLWNPVLLIHRDSLMWIDTLSSTSNTKTCSLLEMLLRLIQPEQCMLLRLRIQSWSTMSFSSFMEKTAMPSTMDTPTCHSSMELIVQAASHISTITNQKLWTTACQLTESLENFTCADTCNQQHRLLPLMLASKKITVHHITGTLRSTTLCRTTSTLTRNKFPLKKFVTLLPKPD